MSISAEKIIHKGASFTQVLKNKDFLFLWLTQLLTNIADKFLLYLLLIFAYRFTRTNLGVSLPMLLFGLSAVLFGPLAGVFVDRWSKKSVMFWSNVIRAILAFAVIPFINSALVLVFLGSFFIFALAQFFAPAETAAIPAVVKKKDLIAANSLFMMTLMAAAFVGFGLAAPMIGLLGNRNILVLIGSVYALSALGVLMINLHHKETYQEESIMGLLKDLAGGLNFILGQPLISYSLFKMFFATGVLASVSLIAVGFCEQILKIGAENFGYLIFAAGGGMLFGAYFLGNFSHKFKKGTLVALGFLFSGISLLVLPYSADLVLSLFLIFFLGMGNAFIVAPLQTILHENIPEEIRGRVFGVQHMIINSAFTFPAVIMGALADVWGIKTIAIILGSLILLSGIFDRFFSKFKNA